MISGLAVKFLLKWIAAQFIGGLVSLLLMNAVYGLLRDIAGLSALMMLVILAAVAGAIVGAAQAIVLVPKTAHAERWIGFTILGYVVGGLLPALLQWDMPWSGLLFGLALGGAQWLVLRRVTPRAAWWILVVTLAAAINIGLVTVIVEALTLLWIMQFAPPADITPAPTQSL